MSEKEFLETIKDYVEQAEIDFSGEFGSCLDLNGLIERKLMPDIYDEILRRLKNI